MNGKLSSMGALVRIMGFHHEALPLANGHLVVLCEQQKPATLAGDTTATLIRGDALLDLDGNWNLGWTWSAFDHLDVNHHPMDVEDWTHGNALLYSPEDGALLFSMRNQHWIAKIDYANRTGNGAVIWKLGPAGDVALTNGDDSAWFYGQHFPTFAETVQGRKRLAIFDNRATNEDGSTCASQGACYSRALIMEVDEGARTATVVWEQPLALTRYGEGAFRP